ncbi:DeoR/GlpR family DNA-binding transcription regulator [Labrenzia sp. 011]|uniref:DeoR/GlpR family DNA-binding transcription regulator n=1 Tax=Labrenzia sp. 011 TaxID=2171494 RepID=UPI000D51EE59|nr:DeoR/GlpR family DNA-binding transcription regulator [Labrenzia sp. 011]PVB61923.1 DeoR family transcriptional regulator [Labrenzia sp. 011]
MFGQIDISKRQAEIADLVQKAGFASVEDLADRFDVTTQTIRRDVNGLCELGILRRTHGGVEPPAPAANIHYSTRQILNLAEKQLIAALVAREVENGSSLAFSIGTTPEIAMQALTGHENLAIFTNNLNVAFTASANPSFQVTIAGGRLRHGDRDVLGSSAQAFFSNYKVDIGIFGVAGVDEDGTLLDFHEDEVAARQSILANCRRSFLVLDHSKFGRNAHVRGGHLGDVDAVFTDRPVPPAILASLTGTKTEVHVADDGN